MYAIPRIPKAAKGGIFEYYTGVLAFGDFRFAHSFCLHNQVQELQWSAMNSIISLSCDFLNHILVVDILIICLKTPYFAM